MVYHPLRASRSPPFFELQVRAAMAQLSPSVLPPPHMMERLRYYLESMLLAESLPPSPRYLIMLLERFSQLVTLSRAGQPIVYKKRKSLSLMFDVFSLQSEMRIDDPDALVLGYTQSMMGFLLLHADPRQIGMVGLGGGSLAKFCYRHLPRAAIAVAEIDAGVIALRDQFYIPPDDARLTVHCVDGAAFVRQAQGRFDVLLVDGFDHTGQPPQLCSTEFYRDCHRALAPGGVMVVNLTCDDSGATAQYLERMRDSFGGAVLVIDALDSLNRVAFACKGGLPELDPGALQERIRQLDMLHPLILRATAGAMLAQRHAGARPLQQA